MHSDNQDDKRENDEIGASSTPGVVRWMLAIGVTVIMVGMALIWLVGRPERSF